MCGIAGIRNFSGEPVPDTPLQAMGSCLAHRGPDDSSTWHGDGVGLAHRRLSVIDLDGSHQPMHSADGRWTLTFNGEIYNYRELRRALSYPFSTSGDTETILAGIATRGLSFVDRLVGQFAFAALDRLNGEVHLVRDRLGVLPLYYYLDHERLIFASEIKAVIAGLKVRPAVDMSGLGEYLGAGSVPAPHTLFEGIAKLPAAHRAVIGAGGGLCQVRYWSPPEPDPSRDWTPGLAVDAVDECVTEAVRAAMVADVPVGAYLSGGLDSSLIVAKAAGLSTADELHTFAAGFGDSRHDELPWARRVSQHLGTSHHEVQVRSTDFAELWSALTWHRDAPVSQPADIAVFRLAEAAREVVTVVLSGEGGDELFAGYPKHQAARAVSLLSRVPASLRAAVGRSVETRLPARFARHRIAVRVLTERTTQDRHRGWFAPFTTQERQLLLPKHPSRESPSRSRRDDRDPLRAMLLEDLRSWLPDNLLERGDRMSMAASLELRPPLLDHRLVELAFRLPSEFKVRKGTTKWVLKEVARRTLPDEIVDRRKVGFQVPLDAWFRDGLRDMVRDQLTGPQSFVAQTFDRSAVLNLLERHESGRFNEQARIFTLMSLEVWHETFYRSSAPLTPHPSQ